MDTHEKSHVSLEQHQCPVCCHIFDTGAVLLDKRLRPVMERATLTGHSLCPQCADRSAADYVALVEVDPTKSSDVEGSTAGQKDVYRTGRIAHIRRHLISRVFTHAISASAYMCFIEIEGYEKLIGMYERSQSTVQ